MSALVRSLLRHKIIVFVLIFQVAAEFGVICNVFNAISAHVRTVIAPTGIQESGLLYLKVVEAPGYDKANVVDIRNTDLLALRGIDGVTSVAYVDSLPNSGDDWTTSLSTVANGERGTEVSASIYNGSPDEIKTLGLRLLAGRKFQDQEYFPLQADKDYAGANQVSVCIITKALADALFGGDAMGREIYGIGHVPARVVGVVDVLHRPSLGASNAMNFSVLLPLLPDSGETYFVMSSNGMGPERIIDRAKKLLTDGRSGRVVTRADRYAAMREKALSRETSVLRFLVISGVLLLLVSWIALYGLFSYWVLGRKKSIGIRRALGARRLDIIKHVLCEGLLLAITGIALGLGFALAISYEMMKAFETHQVSYLQLLEAAIAIVFVSQLAVFLPALRSSRVPPALAIGGM